MTYESRAAGEVGRAAPKFMSINEMQVRAAEERYQRRSPYRHRNERLIRQGRFLEADAPDRVEKFLLRRGVAPADIAEAIREPSHADMPAEPTADQTGADPLERVLGTNDLMGVAFLERGLQVAGTVGRIWVSVSGGQALGYGTGFLVSPRLLMTNHHVLESASVARRSLVQFDYQIGLDGRLLPTTNFELDPDTFFFADAHLDYALVAIRQDGAGGGDPTRYGWNPLIEEEGKAIVSQWLNIVQHPNGEPKQLCLRENQLVDVHEEFITYKTDTAPGSSGSPVFNDRWEVVGLHHSGVWDKNEAGQILALDGSVWHKSMGEHRIKWIANEGARISRIIANLRPQITTPAHRRLFEEVFTTPPEPVGKSREAAAPAPPPPSPNGARVSVSPDGTATWNIPLTVSVSLGQGGAHPSAGTPAASTPRLPAAGEPGDAPSNGARISHPVPTDDAEAALLAAKSELGRRADVLGVRLGYVFRNGWITKERALVATVRQKRAPAALRDAGVPPLPKTFKRLPVEVTNPSIEDLVALARGGAAAEALFSAPDVSPEEITYRPPDNVPLKRTTAQMRVVAHVSPDAGWPKLSEFIAGVNHSLVIGMFDFGAPHVAEAVAALGQKSSFEMLSLVMQRGESVGEGTKADDLTDDQVVGMLRDALPGRFENAWVKIGRVNGWVASSYHIKVAVRDGSAFWLSSGNLQSSNQPKAEPLNENPPRRKWLEQYNREWNVIVEHAPLAKVFKEYLLNDLRGNSQPDGGESLDLPDLLVPETFFAPTAAEAVKQFEYFPPFDEDRVFTVTPLLTPDNYHEEVLRLITGAKKELLIQNQTFNAPGPNHHSLRKLIDAVVARQQAGVDVKIIFRVLMPAKARKVLEQLRDYGVDLSNVRVQKNCHTKGIVVDRERVLIGSQNWSNDGVSVNRDASLLFEDADLAKYFAKIFEHDWDKLATQDIGREDLPVEWVPAGEKAPDGMVRLNWKDYVETL